MKGKAVAASAPTKILFVDSDDALMQVWQCIAFALDGIPPVEFFHATDATDGLSMVEKCRPDVIILNLDEDLSEERDVFMESLYGQHPPVIVPTDEEYSAQKKDDKVIYVTRGGTLDGIHKALLVATSAAQRSEAKTPSAVH